MKKLNLGCGLKYKDGWTNVDFCPAKNFKVDIIHNLEKFPYTFKDNEFDFILMDNVLEHLEETIKTLEELHRIGKPNATIKIIIPHYSGFMAFGHLTHKKFFGAGSLDNFKPDSWEKYSEKNFKVKKKLIWMDSRNVGFFGRIMNKLLNLNRYFTERFLANIIGIDHIEFTLKILK